MDPKKQEIPQPETLFAAALYLATDYVRTGCPMLCRMVMQQLACICNHPGENVPRSLRGTCGKLLAEWERISAARVAVPYKAAVTGGVDRQQRH